MSHIVQIQTEVRDPVAIQAACGRLKLPEPVFGETKLFTSSAVGCPVVCDVVTAKIAFDNKQLVEFDRQLDQRSQNHDDRAVLLARQNLLRQCLHDLRRGQETGSLGPRVKACDRTSGSCGAPRRSMSESP